MSRKLAATQELQRKDTEIEIERKERTKREVQAQGIANAMQIIRGQLNALYIQHEAIEAQKAMVNSPNHTVVYIPSGNDGRAAHGHVPGDDAGRAVSGRRRPGPPRAGPAFPHYIDVSEGESARARLRAALSVGARDSRGRVARLPT